MEVDGTVPTRSRAEISLDYLFKYIPAFTRDFNHSVASMASIDAFFEGNTRRRAEEFGFVSRRHESNSDEVSSVGVWLMEEFGCVQNLPPTMAEIPVYQYHAMTRDARDFVRLTRRTMAHHSGPDQVEDYLRLRGIVRPWLIQHAEQGIVGYQVFSQRFRLLDCPRGAENVPIDVWAPGRVSKDEFLADAVAYMSHCDFFLRGFNGLSRGRAFQLCQVIFRSDFNFERFARILDCVGVSRRTSHLPAEYFDTGRTLVEHLHQGYKPKGVLAGPVDGLASKCYRYLTPELIRSQPWTIATKTYFLILWYHEKGLEWRRENCPHYRSDIIYMNLRQNGPQYMRNSEIPEDGMWARPPVSYRQCRIW